jgi:hypothetical protein
MKDLVIKQTGNSRLLKSDLPAGTSWEEALSQLRDGTFPIDLLGLQTEGIQQMGTYFNKDNMLDDTTASALGLTSDDPTPNEALLALANAIKIAGTKYGTCSTASATTAKTASISGFTLSTGAVVAVKFSNVNTASSPTLNVNSTGAKAIYDWRTNTYPSVGAMLNGTHLFVYNGSQWVLLNPNPGSTLSLESLSWSTISSFASAGIASSLFAVGDTKSVSLSGTCGARTFSSETTYAFILGFDHNSSREGSNKIHFQFGKTSNNVDIAFTDSSYNSTGSTAAFRMNTTNTNSGGWNGSYMKGTIIPAFKSCLPSALQNVLKTVTKYTDNTGGGSNTASYVTSTSETIFLLSEYEVFGARTYANSAEATYQAQYAYYANGNSKIKYRDSATTTACSWWLRSPYATTTDLFCRVGTGGGAYGSTAYYSNGFAPGFCV